MSFRRIFTVCISLVLSFVIAVLAGCGQSEDKGAAFKEVTDLKGTQKIPVNPERVFATQYVETLLALGIKPIGAPQYTLSNPYSAERIAGIENIGLGVNVEKVAELEPDVILDADYTDPAVYEQLTKIAPTVVVPWVGLDVFQQLDAVAALFGKETEAEKWKTDFKSREEQARLTVEGIVKPDETVSIFRADGLDELQVYGARNIGYVLYNSLGYSPPESVRKIWGEDPNFVSNSISMELLPELSGDYIFVLTDEEARGKGGMWDQMENSALWKNIPAVKAGNVIFVDYDNWLAYTPLALEFQLADAVARLTEREAN